MSERTQTAQDQQEAPEDSVEEALQAPRSRRALLAGVAAAAGALVAQAATAPLPGAAANGSNVKVGQTNSGTAPTTIQNTAASASARAIVGRTTYTGAAGTSAGVWGESKGQNGVGVFGSAHTGAGAKGILGNAIEGIGVRGGGGPTGVWGTGTNYGVRGNSDNNYGVFGDGGYAGVFGSGPYGTYGSGTSAGAIGTSGPGYGVYGLGSIGVVGIGDDTGYGVWGYNSDSGGYGMVGQGGYRGVYASGGNAGVYGTSGYVGVWGNASTTTGLNFGVYAYSGSPGGYAGVFSGAVQVSGFLSKLGGGFKIDHPLEPEHRYLVHSFVEAPEMLNVYRGRVKLNSRGRATVRLPRYFEAENAEHLFQLTAIGAAAPNLHIAKEVAGNRFVIAGGTPGLTVSWQVTGARKDAWARKNPMRVEPLKARVDRGKYLAPRAYGRPVSAGILHLERPTRLKGRPRAARRAPDLKAS